MIYSTSEDLCSQPIIGVSTSLDWTGGEIDEFRLRLLRAMAGCQLDRWSFVPTADVGFLSASMGPLTALTFRCAVRGSVPFLVFEANGKC